MAVTAERDRYLFGALESSARNRVKLQEVSYGFEEPEGVLADLAGFCGELDTQELGLADDLWAGLLRHRDDVDGGVAL